MIIAVDFDGTLCENKYPYAGKPNKSLIDALRSLRKDDNAEVILWTCRVEEKLEFAVQWCREQGLEFDAVNENLPRIIEQFGGDNRKIFADVYIDDRSLGFSFENYNGYLEDNPELSTRWIRYLTHYYADSIKEKCAL